MEKKLQSPEQFKSQIYQLLKEYNFLETTCNLNYLEFQADCHNVVAVKTYQEGRWLQESAIDNLDLIKELIQILKNFRLVGNGRGLQKVTIILEKEEISPIINLEIEYFGIE